MATRAKFLLLTGLVTLMFGGCLNLGPDYQRPGVGDDVPVQFAQEVVAGEMVPYNDQWWRIFGKPELDVVLEKVIANNWDIRRAAGRILELRAQALIVRADRYPELDVDWRHRTEVRKVDKRGGSGKSRET
ncbi:MAG: hypothetical protein QNI97_06805, partial [Desulfobacterales bacterium]|nr:hypothetical protein [Desulfobacterales bacterium]